MVVVLEVEEVVIVIVLVVPYSFFRFHILSSEYAVVGLDLDVDNNSYLALRSVYLFTYSAYLWDPSPAARSPPAAVWGCRPPDYSPIQC